MDSERQLKSSSVFLIVLILLCGCALRLIGLGSSSLTLNEAENALSALRLFSGEGHGEILYTLPTALLFKMFGDSDFTARLFPAAAGIILTVLPLMLRKRFGYRKMLLLSFLFAVDPVLLFWSKRADAVIPAAALAAAAAVFFCNRKPLGFWTCLLLTLSGGSRSLPVLVVLLVCGSVYCIIRKVDVREIRPAFSGKRVLLAAGVLFLLAITAFSVYPAGISAFFTGLIHAFGPAPNWAHPGTAAIIIAGLVYCGIPLLLFVQNCILSRRMAFCGFVFVGAVLLILWQGILAFPWISMFLWISVSSFAVSLIASLQGRKDFAFYLTACAVVGSFSFFYFRLVEVFNQQNGSEPVRISWNGTEQLLPLTRVGASVLLTLASVLIIGLILKILLGFFDYDTVRRGILLGCIVICSWGLVTNIWNTGGFDRIGDHPAAFHPENSRNLLNGNYTAFTQTRLFELINEITIKHGDRSKEPFGLNLITDDPLLEWQLRKVKGLVMTGNPHADLKDVELIISDPLSSFQSSGFVGTVQTYRAKTDWSDYNIQEWGKWLLFGDGKNSAETSLIVWAKGDMIYSVNE